MMARAGNARGTTTFATLFAIAAIALLIPVAFMSAWVHAEAIPMQVYSTALGELRHVVLGNHAKAQLNTSTGLMVTNTAQLCEAVLDHGEALFDLGRESNRPLRVLAAGFALSARASVFSVRVHDSKNLDLMVRSGQVTVGAITVRDHQFARISAGGLVLREASDADIDRKLQWTGGQIEFSGDTLADATAEFNRYNSRKLVIADRAIGSLTIGGKFSVKDVDAFVKALRDLGVRPASDNPGDPAPIRLIAGKGPDQ